MDNYNTEKSENQQKNDEILVDKTSTGKDRPWKEKKKKSLELSASYERLGELRKAERVRTCGNILAFKVFSDGSKKLLGAEFCMDRLCSMCAWRRSLKIFGQVSAVMNEVPEDYQFLFLTLTIKNCDGEQLSETIDKLFKGFKALTKKAAFKRAVKGWFRALEVTHNINQHSKSFDTYHPHFHMILCVDSKSYKHNYISQKKWREMWADCMKLDYDPNVYIEKAKGKKAVAEIAKYAVKDSDYLVKHDRDLTDKSVFILSQALKNRRLVGFGGLLKEIRIKLNLEDPEDGDLIHTETESELREDLQFTVQYYSWNVGLCNYTLKQ